MNSKEIKMESDKIKEISLFSFFYSYLDDNSTLIRINKELKEETVVNLRKILNIKESDFANRVDFYKIVASKDNYLYMPGGSTIYRYDLDKKELKAILKLKLGVTIFGLSENEKYLIYNQDQDLCFFNIKTSSLVDINDLEDSLIRKDYSGKEFILFNDNRVFFLKQSNKYDNIRYLPILNPSENTILSANPEKFQVDSFNYITGEKKTFLKKGRVFVLVGIIQNRYLLYYYNPIFNNGEEFPLYCYDLKKDQYFNLHINSKHSDWFLEL